MNETQRQGYLIGITLVILAALFIILAQRFPDTPLTPFLWPLTLLCGVVGIGSLWKPELLGRLVTNRSETPAGSGEPSPAAPAPLQPDAAAPPPSPAPAQTLRPASTRHGALDPLSAYSHLHRMIHRVNAQVPRDTALHSLVGGFVRATAIDHQALSAIFQHSGAAFRAKDMAMWRGIEQQIREMGGFYVGRERQQWFDALDAEYHRLRTANTR